MCFHEIRIFFILCPKECPKRNIKPKTGGYWNIVSIGFLRDLYCSIFTSFSTDKYYNGLVKDLRRADVIIVVIDVLFPVSCTPTGQRRCLAHRTFVAEQRVRISAAASGGQWQNDRYRLRCVCVYIHTYDHNIYIYIFLYTPVCAYIPDP